MNGAESLVATLVACGVDVCFANPGTSEMHFVAALDKVPQMRSVLCLFEGVVTGAADGYGRMAEKPAATLLHLGPGLANGLANLHNARRANSPIVNIVGDHATYHGQYDAPLSSDIVGFARPVSGWIHQSSSSKTVAADGARAVQAAMAAPGQIATLILPADTAWLDANSIETPLDVEKPAPVSGSAIDQVRAAIQTARRPMILMRGRALQERGLEAAGRIAAKTAARLTCDTFAPRLQRGAGLVPVDRIPYFAEQIVDFMNDVDLLILVGAKPPVAFFAYPNKPSWCTPDGCKILYLAHPHQDGVAALEDLADALGGSTDQIFRAPLERPETSGDRFNAFTIGQVLARRLPENAIVVDESGTATLGTNKYLLNVAPHDHLALTGGSIGQGIPVALGAAIACPNRKVVCLQGDGGGMYTLQALWTMARERLDVTIVIFANRSYGILNVELKRVEASDIGPRALAMLDLTNPNISWAKLAEGMGVMATSVNKLSDFETQFLDAVNGPGPRLIEVIL